MLDRPVVVQDLFQIVARVWPETIWWTNVPKNYLNKKPVLGIIISIMSEIGYKNLTESHSSPDIKSEYFNSGQVLVI